MQVGYAKIVTLSQYIWLSERWLWHVSNNCDGPLCSLPHRWRRISESCLSQPAAWTTTTKRREENLIVRSSKSEAEVTNNTRLRSMYCTKLPTGRHEALRGLSATAELGVSLPQLVSFPAVSCLALASSCLGLTLLWPKHESC